MSDTPRKSDSEGSHDIFQKTFMSWKHAIQSACQHMWVAAYRAILVLHESVLYGRLLSKVDIAFTVYFFALYNIRNMNKTHVSVADIQNLAAQILKVLGNDDLEFMKKKLETTDVYETLEFLQCEDCELLLRNMVEEEETNPGQMLTTLKSNVGSPVDNRPIIKQLFQTNG